MSLLESPKFYRSLIDSISSSLCVVDAESTIVWVNDAWQRFANENGALESFVGTSYLEVCAVSDEAGASDAGVVARGFQELTKGAITEFNHEYPCHSPTQRRWFTLNIRPLNWSGDTLYIIKHNDITSRKLAEIEVDRKNRELTRSNRELDQFAYIASHDLQEPIRTVATMARVLADDPDSTLSQQAEQAKGFMIEACDRMQDLVHGLLEHSRLGRGRDPELTDIGEVITHVLRDLQTRIQERDAQVKVEGEMPVMQAYPLEVRLLFQNLISNAIKFCPAERKPQISVTCQAVGDHRWRFCIEDNGLGVPPEEQEKIFQIFQRSSAVEGYEGTGIGLSHCLKVAELHGGRIWVESTGEGGSTFFVELENLQLHAK